MISPNELRIGNILNHPFYGVCFVHEIRQDWIIPKVKNGQLGAGGKPEGFDGIPLTEDWLLKMGFEKDGIFKEEFVFTKGKWFYQIELKQLFLITGYDGDPLNYIGHEVTSGDISIQFVHQLQNLYWCLCGKELEIKL